MRRRDVIKQVFNRPDEVHVFVNGLFRALTTLKPRPSEPESVDELHYWRAGYLVGKGVHTVAVLAVAWVGLGP